MNSRERVGLTLRNVEPDRVPLDLGGSPVTGMQVNTVYRLRQALLDDFAAAGFDILNPVQCSAAQMDPAVLKDHYGSRFTFWGGGVDTQRTLPFGTPDEVRREVAERIGILGRGGGFVFNTVHNVQAQIPVENVLAMYETVREAGRYPVREPAAA